MDIDKLVSPFAVDISFTDIDTLLKAFRQKALAEGWDDDEVDYVIKEASKGGLESALSVILSYTDVEDEEEFDALDLEGEEDPFKGEEDFEVEDES